MNNSPAALSLNGKCDLIVNQITQLKNDTCAQNVHDAQSTNFGDYHLNNINGVCGGGNARNCALENPMMSFRDGYGWVSYDGCLVDYDTQLRNKFELTKQRVKHQLFPRIFIEGYRGIGERDIEAENFIVVGKEDPNQRKPCEVTSGASQYPERFEELHEHSNPQRVQHIVPPKPDEGGWIRGGADTRMELRRLKSNKCPF